MAKNRKSNIEWLRIFCMTLIVAYHYAIYSKFTFDNGITINKMIIQFLSIGGEIGVNCFILISGYFLVDSQFKTKKVVKIILETVTYSIIFLIMFNVANAENITLTEYKKSIMPVTFSLYWFITAYIILYIFSPYINKLLNTLEKVDTIKLILMLVVIESIIPTIFNVNRHFSHILWFITLYIMGAYLKRNPIKVDNRKVIATSIILYLSIFISILIFDLISLKIEIFKGHELYFLKRNSILTLITSVTIFLSFVNLKVKENKIINKIASTMLGVYIIHENVFVRKILWCKVFKSNLYVSSNFLIVNAIFSITFTMIICVLIDLIRRKTIEKVEIKLFDNISEIFLNTKICKKIKKQFNRIK